MRHNMNRILSPILTAFVLCVAFAAAAVAQDSPPPDMNRPIFEGPRPNRPNLLRILGLSPEQAQQLRRLNQERKPLMDAAARRLREANRALDEAIYADSVDETLFQARLKDLQLAQAEMAKLRFLGELNVRKILTPEQLARFRELRRRFAQPPPDQQSPPSNDSLTPGRRFQNNRRRPI